MSSNKIIGKRKDIENINLDDIAKRFVETSNLIAKNEYLISIGFNRNLHIAIKATERYGIDYTTLNKDHAKCFESWFFTDPDCELILKCENPGLLYFVSEVYKRFVPLDQVDYTKVARAILFKPYTDKNIMEIDIAERIGYFPGNEKFVVNRERFTHYRTAIIMLSMFYSIIPEEECQSCVDEFNNMCQGTKKAFGNKLYFAYFWKFCKDNDCIDKFISSLSDKLTEEEQLLKTTLEVMGDKFPGFELSEIQKLDSPYKIYRFFKEDIYRILDETTESSVFFRKFFEVCCEKCPQNPELVSDILAILTLFWVDLDEFSAYSFISHLNGIFSREEFLSIFDRHSIFGNMEKLNFILSLEQN